ncbi:hypothetical protein [Acidaminococcus massiliensis]|uniref:hypothetical protein n=1 Tax=Acidaminococcus massiliensis TaxID=1852375 RepID=UPI0023F0ADCE|nr:hypothetical protein [Acidaminococcus massiliensis]
MRRELPINFLFYPVQCVLLWVKTSETGSLLYARQVVGRFSDGCGAVSYSDILLDFKKTSYVEENLVPNDAEVIGQTWLKVNKNGTPDKRFKDNRQLPICAYGTSLYGQKTKICMWN